MGLQVSKYILKGNNYTKFSIINWKIELQNKYVRLQ